MTIYSVVSGKGGVGKTTSAINLGAALNFFGKKVLIVDANLSTPNIGIHLGAPIVPVSLNHVLENKAKLMDAIYEHNSGMKILPSSLSCDVAKLINPRKFAQIIEELRKYSSQIILDSSPGLGKESYLPISCSDEVILVTQAEMPAVADSLKTARLARQLKKPIKGFILTRYKKKKSEMAIENIIDMLEVPLLGIVPEDKNMQKALSKKDAILHTHPKSKASKAYKEIARKMLGIEEPGFLFRLFKR